MPQVALTQNDLGLKAEKNDIEVRKEKARAITGASQVAAIHVPLDALKRQGVLGVIHVYGSTLFEVSARWTDLGVSTNAKRRKRIKAGIKRLAPNWVIDKHSTLESRARALLKKYGRDVTGFWPYQFIPFTAWTEFKAKLDEIIAEDTALIEQIIAELPDIRAKAEQDYKAIAQEAWVALIERRTTANVKATGVEVDGQKFATRAAFVAYVVDDVLARIPNEKDIREKMRITFATAVLASDTDIAAEEQEVARLTQIRVETEAQIAKAQSESRLADLRVWEEQQAANERLLAMKNAQIAIAREALTNLANPVLEMVDQIRAQLGNAVNDMYATIKRNGKIHGKNAEQAHALVEFYNLIKGGVVDKVLEEKLAALSYVMGPPGTKRDVVDVTRALEGLRAELALTAKEIVEAAPDRIDFIEF